MLEYVCSLKLKSGQVEHTATRKYSIQASVLMFLVDQHTQLKCVFKDLEIESEKKILCIFQSSLCSSGKHVGCVVRAQWGDSGGHWGQRAGQVKNIIFLNSVC